MSVVLIHGGACTAPQWSRLAPLLDGPVLAVNLPGRRGKDGDHANASFADWARSVLADMDEAGIERADFIGHSLGGGTLLALARQAPERVRRLVFVAAVLPEEGGMIVDRMPPDAQVFIRDLRAKGEASLPENPPPKNAGGKDMVDYVTREAVSPFFDPISFVGVRAGIPCTYVKLMRDKSIPTQDQHVMADTLAKHTGCDFVEVDTGHIGMLTHPELFAEAMNSILAR